MRTRRDLSWVVYESLVGRAAERVRSVCGASEWPALAAERPGSRTLVTVGVATEGEAERLARGTAGDTPPRVSKPRPVIPIIAPCAPDAEPHSARHKSGQFAPLPVSRYGTA